MKSSVSERVVVTLKGCSVQLMYPRNPWQPWKRGWFKHVDGLGRKCWVRHFWSKQDE